MALGPLVFQRVEAMYVWNMSKRREFHEEKQAAKDLVQRQKHIVLEQHQSNERLEAFTAKQDGERYGQPLPRSVQFPPLIVCTFTTAAYAPVDKTLSTRKLALPCMSCLCVQAACVAGTSAPGRICAQQRLLGETHAQHDTAPCPRRQLTCGLQAIYTLSNVTSADALRHVCARPGGQHCM